jgi:tRNA C32,U32 (ribose-2'-O)-methylase TrmJ
MSEAHARAEHAKRLLEDALLTEVLDEIEKAAINAWASTTMGDHENREMAYHALKASRRVRDALKGVVDNGLIEARRVARP